MTTIMVLANLHGLMEEPTMDNGIGIKNTVRECIKKQQTEYPEEVNGIKIN